MVLLGFLAAPSRACNVPVFRYALEKWQPERYEAVVFHRGLLPPAGQAAVQVLEKARDKAFANLDVKLVDTGSVLAPEVKDLWKDQPQDSLPRLVVRGGNGTHSGVVWAGPLDEGNARRIVDSPARRTMTKSLLEGQASVWLLLESGDESADNAAAAMIEKELKSLETELELPPPAADDPPMQATLPLRVAFSLVRVSRKSPEESAFVAQLLAGEPEAARSRKPVAFPVFGRGRALPPMAESDLGPELLGQACRFIIGGCACSMKELNPGFDLLLAADWEAVIDGRVVKPPGLPPLAGLSQFVVPPTIQPVASPSSTNSAPAQPAVGGLKRNLLFVLALGAAALVFGTLVLKSKTGIRQP